MCLTTANPGPGREWFAEPFRYLGANVRNGLALLEMAVARGVRRFILSSTANPFDAAAVIPIGADARVVPGSPYGESKYILERVLAWLDRTVGLRYAALRYFNVAGASPRLGEDHEPAHLIANVLNVALGRRSSIEVYGADYPTPTARASAITSVIDLADAHIQALRAVEHGSLVCNLGNGRGYSVLEVIEMTRAFTGSAIPVEPRPRRPGDPAVLVADNAAAMCQLDWRPRHAELSAIIESAWRWRWDHPDGYHD